MTRELKRRFHRRTPKTEFMIYVLWMHGSSVGAIASFLGQTRGQVSGVITRAPFPSRGTMSLEQRKEALDELRLIREDDAGHLIDEGALPDATFTPRRIGDRRGRR